MKLYEMIYTELKKQIADGVYRPGTLLPTELALQNKYHVSRITVQHAYDRLAHEGLVRRVPGKGTVLAEQSRKQTPKLIGLVLCDFNAAFGEKLLKSIEYHAGQHGYSILLRRSLDNHETESRVLTQLTEQGVSGLLIQNCHGAFTKNLIALSLREFPIVSVDRYARGLLIPSVTSDNYNAGIAAASYLLRKGHKKILFASANPESTSTLTERIDGFKQAHINRDIALSSENFVIHLASPITHAQADIEADLEQILDCLRRTSVTAILAAERWVADLCCAAVEKCGASVPADYELLCFDHEDTGPANRQYTHIAQNETEMGRQAVKQLLRQIENGSAAMRTTVPCTLRLGFSTLA